MGVRRQYKQYNHQKVNSRNKVWYKNSDAKRNGSCNNNWEELRIFWHYWRQIKHQNDPNLGASFVEPHFKAEDKRHNNRVGVDNNRYYEVCKVCDEGRPIKRTALWGKIKYRVSKSRKSVDHIDDVHFDLTQEYYAEKINEEKPQDDIKHLGWKCEFNDRNQPSNCCWPKSKCSISVMLRSTCTACHAKYSYHWSPFNLFLNELEIKVKIVDDSHGSDNCWCKLSWK